jgi:hypothetical protein
MSLQLADQAPAPAPALADVPCSAMDEDYADDPDGRPCPDCLTMLPLGTRRCDECRQQALEQAHRQQAARRQARLRFFHAFTPDELRNASLRRATRIRTAARM